MKITKIQLQGFRNYKSKLFEFGDVVSVLVGPNAAGKTNVLEAINLLATGNSFRAKKIDEMVGWDIEVGHVGGKIISRDDNELDLKVAMTRGMVQGERSQKRKYSVNGVPRRKGDFVGGLVVVSFLPSDLRLISGSPSRRRGYLDGVLSQVDKEYYRSLSSYEKALRRRNKLLDAIRDGQASRSGLMFWDQLLIKEGNIVSNKRQDFIDFINKEENELRVVYDDSSISEGRLKQYERQEVMAGHTLVGPHKDDFFIESVLESRSRDLSVFGSRGEQRMAVLWLKMREIDFVEKSLGKRPVLLLDDIFSELDDNHDRQVWDLVGRQQTIITTTDLKDVRSEKARVIQLK